MNREFFLSTLWFSKTSWWPLLASSLGVAIPKSPDISPDLTQWHVQFITLGQTQGMCHMETGHPPISTYQRSGSNSSNWHDASLIDFIWSLGSREEVKPPAWDHNSCKLTSLHLPSFLLSQLHLLLQLFLFMSSSCFSSVAKCLKQVEEESKQGFGVAQACATSPYYLCARKWEVCSASLRLLLCWYNGDRCEAEVTLVRCLLCVPAYDAY